MRQELAQALRQELAQPPPVAVGHHNKEAHDASHAMAQKAHDAVREAHASMSQQLGELHQGLQQAHVLVGKNQDQTVNVFRSLQESVQEQGNAVNDMRQELGDSLYHLRREVGALSTQLKTSSSHLTNAVEDGLASRPLGGVLATPSSAVVAAIDRAAHQLLVERHERSFV